MNEGQTRVALEQGELQLQGEGWRGDTPEAPHVGSPSLFHMSLCFLAPPFWLLPETLGSQPPAVAQAGLLSPLFFMFPPWPCPTSSLAHLSDQPRQDVEGNFTFCGFGFGVSTPTA